MPVVPPAATLTYEVECSILVRRTTRGTLASFWAVCVLSISRGIGTVGAAKRRSKARVGRAWG